MSQIVTAHFEVDGGIIYVPIGFVPSYLMLCQVDTDTYIIFYHWWSAMEDDAATGYQEGISVTEGVTANLADAGGITTYDSESASPTVTAWTQAVGSAATARTATAAGVYVKPATTSKGDKSAIFECVTDGTSAATEPDWDDDAPAIGDQVMDGTTLWERVDTPLVRKGYKGICIAAALCTNGDEMYMLAMDADRDVDLGDVDGWTDGIAAPSDE